MHPQYIRASSAGCCSVDNCDAPIKARGFCSAHYWAWWAHGDPLFIPVRMRPLAERFWAYVHRGEPDACWLWSSTTSGNGYGQIRIADGGPRRYLLAHRVSWEMHHGPIPDGLLVCHHCDVRACCNPAHLFLGTQSDNIRDMVAKGRQVIRVTVVGSQKASAKLTEAQVTEARRCYAQGDHNVSALSRAYGVSWAAMAAILRREKWKHTA